MRGEGGRPEKNSSNSYLPTTTLKSKSQRLKWRKEIRTLRNRSSECDFWSNKTKGSIDKQSDGRRDLRDQKRINFKGLKKQRNKKMVSSINSNSTSQLTTMELPYRQKDRFKKHLKEYRSINSHINKFFSNLKRREDFYNELKNKIRKGFKQWRESGLRELKSWKDQKMRHYRN